MNNIIIYELNEVPWRVVDAFIERRPNSCLAKFLGKSVQLTTTTVDSGELHPWSTWPTFHRGVSNDIHNIRFLNQDLNPSSNYPTIWDLLAKNGITTGIFGCLQSYPPSKNEKMRFHIPDTFAPGSETLPVSYEAFQKLNLSLTSRNKAVAGKIGINDFLSGLSLLSTGIKANTVVSLVKQLAMEKRNKLFRSRRPQYQALVAFDVFFHVLKKEKPQYAAFFSNHVAGSMHRYWKYLFPEDFDYQLKDKPFDQFHADTVIAAMDIFDQQLVRLWRYAKETKSDLIIASSMGQEAIKRGNYVSELLLNNVRRFQHFFDIEHVSTVNLAMQPDVVVDFSTNEAKTVFLKKISTVKDKAGKSMLSTKYDPVNLTVNFQLRRSVDVEKNGCIYYGSEKFPIEELGLQLINRDVGTGYHQPEGILIWNQFDQEGNDSRDIVDSRQFVPSVLKHFDIDKAGYMLSPIEK